MSISLFEFSQGCGASRNQLGFVCDCVNKHICFALTGAGLQGGGWGGGETEGVLLNRIYFDSWGPQLKCDRAIWEPAFNLSLLETRRMSGMNYSKKELCVCVSERVVEGDGGGGVIAERDCMKWGSRSCNTCVLQAQTRPGTKPEGNTGPAPPPSPPGSSLFCGQTHNVTQESAQEHRRLPVEITSNYDWRYLLLTTEPPPHTWTQTTGGSRVLLQLVISLAC